MAEKWETSGLDDNHFHSSRKERYELDNRSLDSDKKSFFQRNPSFKIFLIDLLFIVIISGVIVPFIYKREGSGSIEGYKLELRAFYFDDQVMASLTVIDDESSLSADTYMEAEFHLRDSLESEVVRDLVPAAGRERILKTTLPRNGEETLICRIEVDGKSKTLKKKIR